METWLPVEGFDDYEVSDLGRVRSLGRTVEQLGLGGARYTRRLPSVMLRPGLAHGYRIIVLRRGGKSVTSRIPILVCRAFNGPKPVSLERIEVAHLDGSRTNDVPGNLRWTTCKENNGHKKAHGTQPFGRDHPHAKLSDAKVVALRSDYKKGARVNALAAKYGVCRATIQSIVNRITWRHVA